jgi:hypothetical protein
MAEEVQIQGTNEKGKIRHPLGILGLMFITFGIYGIVWYYKINKEMAEIGRAKGTDELGTSPGTSVLAVTLGVFILVPPFVSVYKTWERLTKTEKATGTPEGLEPALGFLLSLFVGPVGTYLLQSNLNKALQHQAQLPAQTSAPTQA